MSGGRDEVRWRRFDDVSSNFIPNPRNCARSAGNRREKVACVVGVASCRIKE